MVVILHVSDSHNYHDENHDDIEFYLGICDRGNIYQYLTKSCEKNQIFEIIYQVFHVLVKHLWQTDIMC